MVLFFFGGGGGICFVTAFNSIKLLKQINYYKYHVNFLLNYENQTLVDAVLFTLKLIFYFCFWLYMNFNKEGEEHFGHYFSFYIKIHKFLSYLFSLPVEDSRSGINWRMKTATHNCPYITRFMYTKYKHNVGICQKNNQLRYFSYAQEE